MKRYKFYVGTGYVGAEREEEVEFEDDVTDEELKQSYEEWAWGVLDSGWEEIG